MQKVLQVLGVVAIVGLLAGCGVVNDLEDGDRVVAEVRLDPNDTCRVIVTKHYEDDKMAAFTAHIDGCKATP